VSTIEALVEIWQTIDIAFVEPSASLHIDETREKRCS
jgi:hypothetical protein